MLGLSKILNIRLYSNIKTTRNILEPLKHRSLLRVAGNEVKEFLQGLITNDINHLSQSLGGSMYTMFLNTKGRVIQDTIIYRTKEIDTFLVECDNGALDQLAKHLKMYRVRRKIDIVSMKDELHVHVLFSNNSIRTEHDENASHTKLDGIVVPCDTLKGTMPETSTSTTIYKNLSIYKDPRVIELGSRIISKEGTDVKQQITELVGAVESPHSHENYKLLRYSLGIGEGINDLPSDNCFPLECNCDYLHGISFHKGCYIGQELTARTHHTGVVRKRLMPLYFKSVPTKLPVDSIIIHQTKNIGKLRGVEGNLGLALLRVSSALEFGNITVGNGIASVQKPHWWPLEAPKEKINMQKS
ncbi:putative transferase CAF17 homolog, mitochondrial [Leptinotarsa decemlineata]|uniref:putative transferase CAF17 homolog, mitochondrial n=1 Tax=Leptinotarsa decemlineata TaxID=7539 RepID=UPI003D30590D